MTSNCYLARPSTVFRDSYLEALREGFTVGGGEPIDAGAIAAIAADFPAHLKGLDRDGQVGPEHCGRRLAGAPSTMFWLIEDGAFVGAVSIRARIDTAVLASVGGHIAYGVRPSRRGQGYGARQLALALDIARGMGIGLARITCLADNAASRRTIERNGGLFLRTIESHWAAPGPILVFEIPLV